MIDFNSSMLLHYQVREYILSQIADGNPDFINQLPSETVLAEKLMVSRNTVRQAVLSLVASKHLYRKQGKGTYVNKEPFTRGVPVLTGFHEYIYGLGQTPSSYIKSVDIIDGSDKIRKYLAVANDKNIVKLTRIVYIDNILTGYHNIFIAEEVWAQINMNIKQLANISLYSLFEKKCRLKLVSGDESIYLRDSTGEERQMLDLPDNMPLLVIERLVYDEHHHPVCYAENMYDPYRYRYYIKDRKP
jgi:DNA-binding GntR family transcriptional regulator